MKQAPRAYHTYERTLNTNHVPSEPRLRAEVRKNSWSSPRASFRFAPTSVNHGYSEDYLAAHPEVELLLRRLVGRSKLHDKSLATYWQPMIAYSVHKHFVGLRPIGTLHKMGKSHHCTDLDEFLIDQAPTQNKPTMTEPSAVTNNSQTVITKPITIINNGCDFTLFLVSYRLRQQYTAKVGVRNFY